MRTTDDISQVEDETGELVTSRKMGIRTKGRSPLQRLQYSRVLWKHIGSAFAFVAVLYICYIYTAVSSNGGRSHMIIDNNLQYLQARDVYLQNILVNSEMSTCPVNQPVLQTLENNTDLLSYIPCTKMFYNRVPKCGSRTVMGVIKELGLRYNYTVKSALKPRTGLNYYKDFSQLTSFIANFSELPQVSFYAQHLHFVNFSKFHIAAPLYMNVIRDPVERLISHYYYRSYGSNNAPLATPDHRFNLTIDECVHKGHRTCLGINSIIPFFCGHDKRCRSHKRLDDYVLQVAKRRVRESYVVVGITEDLLSLMEVLETLMPHFFFNATEVFREKQEAFHQLYQTVKKPAVSAETKTLLKDHLGAEYEFYQFIQQRFYTLLNKVRSMKGRYTRRKEKREFLQWWNSS